jgi:uncharacterized membrane protein
METCTTDTVDRPTSRSGILGKSRIENLADGVFSIAMTLLILEVRVPEIADHTETWELVKQLLAVWPKLLSFCLSFVVLGVYWVGHHNQFHYVRHTDRPFLWINIFYLMSISFLPFSAGLLGTYNTQQVAVMIYGFHLTTIGLISYWHWAYAWHHNLLDPHLDPRVYRMTMWRILMAPILSVIAIGLSFVSLTVSVLVYMLLLVACILPSRRDWRFSVFRRHPSSE